MSDKNHYTTWEELLEEYFFAETCALQQNGATQRL
ncbi:Uncharacterised protein [Klebsiella pneumoniae subsp. ozaenae]|uniref:Uncharacterized protein n=1 Tax=Klebsiella pneumoniae subsp. ozaenae TaxID=574 RepID=A0A378ARS8_KLEPO|nr:Uncharacterised protein [Klebsiella pneumoniae subsp. ozaenae]